jgi:hypothetical protein
MNAHRVSAAAAVTAWNAEVPLALNGSKLSSLRKNRPMVAMASSGTSLSTVVTAWTSPPWRTPRALIQVNNQIAATATDAASSELVASPSQKVDR